MSCPVCGNDLIQEDPDGNYICPNGCGEWLPVKYIRWGNDEIS